jgi:hypothetical protein
MALNLVESSGEERSFDLSEFEKVEELLEVEEFIINAYEIDR